MNWPAGTEFILYEEIKHNMIELMKPKQTFQQSEIQDGDIITFQKSIKESELPPTALYTDAKLYYDYLLNRITVTFAPLKANDGDEISLVLSRKMSYDQFSKKVGEALSVDYTHLRFAPVIATTGKPRAYIKRNPNQNAQTLQNILFGQMGAYAINNIRQDALYYEVLETSLSDFESKITLSVTWLPEGISKEVSQATPLAFFVDTNNHISKPSKSSCPGKEQFRTSWLGYRKRPASTTNQSTMYEFTKHTTIGYPGTCSPTPRFLPATKIISPSTQKRYPRKS
jgi:hypothetical protein